MHTHCLFVVCIVQSLEAVHCVTDTEISVWMCNVNNWETTASCLLTNWFTVCVAMVITPSVHMTIGMGCK